MKKLYIEKVLSFLKKNIVMLIALIAALITMVFVPVDNAY